MVWRVVMPWKMQNRPGRILGIAHTSAKAQQSPLLTIKQAPGETYVSSVAGYDWART